MKQALKKAALAVACAGGMAATMQAEAANWLMLQGTEPSSAAGRAKVWGFLQPTYQKDTSDEGGPEPTRIGPNLENQEQFQLYRARIGVRGVGMPIDPKVNYFVMFEMGSNGATHGTSFGERTPVRAMDASITFNHIKGARVRTGLFKTPGPEEILQGIITFDYINLTDVSNQMMMERFPTGVTCGALTDSNGDTVTPPGCANGANPFSVTETQWGSSFGAGRDIGIQVFDSFKTGGWDTSYAVMLGNGNGLETGGIADGMDKYFYLSTEMDIPGGKGPWKNGMKLFAWSHSGTREVDMSDDGTANPVKYDRKRQGLGVTYRRDGIRVFAEYMRGEGMIFQGPEKPNMGIGALDVTNPNSTQDLEGKANGYYLDLGYRFPQTNWELDLRYDRYNRSTDHDWLSAEFKTITYGVQYHFNRKTRVAFNYAVRDAKATDPIPAAAGGLKNMTTALHNGLDSIENRIALQATHVF
jgi:predicted porin